MQKLTTTIKREPYEQIVAKEKHIEYRKIKKYWIKRLARYKTPFLLRLINGMSKSAPEVTVVVRIIKKSRKYPGNFELHLGRIMEVKNYAPFQKRLTKDLKGKSNSIKEA